MSFRQSDSDEESKKKDLEDVSHTFDMTKSMGKTNSRVKKTPKTMSFRQSDSDEESKKRISKMSHIRST